MNNQYITTQELAEELAIPQRQAVAIIKTVNNRLLSQGALILKTRPMRAPRNEVYDLLHLERK